MSATPVTFFTVNGSKVATGSSENDLIGSTATLNLQFSNASTMDAGYTPFIDLVLPAGSNGVSFAGATYLGTSLEAQTITFDSSGNATNPFLKDASGTAVVITGPPGATLVVLSLPFGSFTPGQTPADIAVSLHVAASALVNSALNVTATGGFADGDSATGVSASNPPILGTTATYNVVPQVVTLRTVYVGPEQETATGPSYPHNWDAVATIAPGQTLTNLVLTETLPNGAVYLPGSTKLLYGSGAVAGTITYNAATNTVTGTFPGSVTGGVAGTSPTLQVGFYVSQEYGSGTTILDPVTGAFAPLTDSSSLTANWASSNTANPSTVAVSGVTDTITAKSIAVQSGVSDLTHTASAYQSGDTLQYSLDGQVSNYFDLNALTLQDTMGDGQTFKSSVTPAITIAEGGKTLYSGKVTPAEYTVGAKAADGTSVVAFNVSKILSDHGDATDLNGGGTAAPEPATVDVTFDTTIDTSYSVKPTPSVSKLVDQGDSITGAAQFSGHVASSGDEIADTSGTIITLPTNTVAKTVYAVDGKVVTGPVTIQAGDTVTYELKLATPLTSTQDATLADFLPLPVFSATDPAADGKSTGFAFIDAESSTAPIVGTAEFGPTDTFHAAVPGDIPTVSTDGTANSLTFNLGSYTLAPTTYPSNTVDILYTVRAGDEPFADGLLLTNQVTASETNSFGTVTKSNAIVQVKLGEPVLKVEKAVVATDDKNATFSGNKGPDTYSAPGSNGTRFSGGTIDDQTLAASPLSDSLHGIVAGDTVTFAVVVQNTGNGPNGVFNVILNDTIPTGFNAPTNVRVTDGAGHALAYTVIGGGLFDPNGGIELVDNGSTGALTADETTSGGNIAVITYDAKASATVPVPNYDLHNVAVVTHYAAEAGGANDTSTSTAANLSASSDVYTATPTFAKSVVATSADTGSLSKLAIGATATYDITLTLTKGTANNVTIRDLLPSGTGGTLGLVSATVTSIGSDVVGSALAVGDGADKSGAFVFGTLSDTSNTQSASDQVVVQVVARATDTSTNKGGESVTNTATLTETDPNNPTGTPYAQTATATEKLVEPELKITKTASETTAQAGDVVTYTLKYTNGSDANAAAAYNTVITDSLSKLTAADAGFIAGSVKVASTSTATAAVVDGNGAGDTGVVVDVAEIDPGKEVDITYQVAVPQSAVDGSSFSNTASYSAATLAAGDSNARTETGSASANVKIGTPSVLKTLIAGSDANIAVPNLAAGETGTYQLVVTLPHGQSPNFSVLDVIPTGMSYVAGSAAVQSVGSNLSVGAEITTVSGSNVTFGFGNVSDSGTGVDGTADQIVFDYQATVAATAANGSGVKDTNTAYTAVNGVKQASGTAIATLVAPQLTLSKTGTLNAAHAQAGTDVTYTLTLGQSGTSPAYGIVLTDALPTDETYDAGSATATGGAAVSYNNGVLLVSDPVMLAGAAPIAVSYSAHLNTTVTPGEAVRNTATVVYSSQATGGYAETPVTASSIVNVDLLPTEVKSILALSNNFSTSNVVAGETVTYKLLTTLAPGTQHFQLSDALPNGLTFVSAAVASIGADVSGAGLKLGAVTPATGSTSFDFGTVVAAPGNGSADQVEVDLVAMVNNVAAGTTMTNTAMASTSAPGSNTVGLESSTSSAATLTEVKSSVSGTVFLDNNDDGVLDGADVGMAGVTVKLLQGGVATGATAVTNAVGNYSFTGLNLGNYCVQVVAPTGDGFSVVGTNSSAALDSIVSTTGVTPAVAVQPGANSPNQNAGLYVPVSLSGLVFTDVNADGTQEAGDAGVAGVTATLLSGTTVVAKAQTNASGAYSFTGLKPGSYMVEVAAPTGEAFSAMGTSTSAPNSIVKVASR